MRQLAANLEHEYVLIPQAICIIEHIMLLPSA